MGQVTISLNGRGYRLNCGAGEEGRLRELAVELNLRLERLAVDFGQQADDRLLVMAALLLTDELLELKARLGASEASVGAAAPEPETLVSAEPDAAAPPSARSAEKPEQKVSAASAAKPTGPSGAAAGPGRPGAQRMSLEARLAEARAGRANAPPKPGTT